MYSDSIDQERSLTSVDSLDNLSDEMMRIEKRLIRRLDYIYVMPCVCLMVVIQLFDKGALNYSAVLGIRTDNNLTDSQFGWLGSIFFIGYLIYQIPNAYFVQKLHLGKYLGAMVFFWGIVLGTTAASKNFTHLAILRFLLGVFEAGGLSCVYILISRVYRRKEQAGRICAVFFSGGISLSIGGIVCYGIGHMGGLAQMEAWQWVMLLLGCVTILFGIICFFLLIDDPRSIATSDQERILIELRTKDNAVVVTRNMNYQHVLEALKEVRFYCFSGMSFLVSLQNGALSVFGSIITKGFGYSNLNSILLSIPSGVMICFFISVAIVCQKRFPNSTLYIGCGMLVCSIIGLILLLTIPINQVKLCGFYICMAYVTALSMMTTSISNNVSGYTKKIIYNCAVIFFYAIGNFVGPQLMIPSQSPLYMGGMITYLVSNAISILLLLIARYSMAKLNKQRESDNKDPVFNEKIDITDLQDDHFIYRL